MASPQVTELLKLQAAVRAQGEEQADALASMKEWMDQVKVKDGQLKSLRPGQPTPVSPLHAEAANAGRGGSATKGTAADHTYDKGYKRWEKFNEDAALEQAEKAPAPAAAKTGYVSAGYAMRYAGQAAHDGAARSARPANAAATAASPADMLREDGNAAMKRGDYQAAISYYTRLLAIDGNSVAAYANRAQAFLQIKDYRSAIADATSALRHDPYHVKSWMRRAAARTALGLAEAATRDLAVALKLEPHNRTVAAEYRKAVETTKHNSKRIPDVPMKVVDAE